jgi:hypothetical protein
MRDRASFKLSSKKVRSITVPLTITDSVVIGFLSAGISVPRSSRGAGYQHEVFPPCALPPREHPPSEMIVTPLAKPLLSVTEYHGLRIVGVGQALQIIAART